jgi:replicative DNA helicase
MTKNRNLLDILILIVVTANFGLYLYGRFTTKSVDIDEYTNTIKTLKASKHIIEAKDKMILDLINERKTRDSVISSNNNLIVSLAGELNRRNVQSIKIANDTAISEIETMDILSKLKRYED